MKNMGEQRTWRSHISGMSVLEVVQEPSTSDSSDKEICEDMSNMSKKHQQQASGLLALVFSRSEGRSAKDHYPFQSHGLHQHMQMVNS